MFGDEKGNKSDGKEEREKRSQTFRISLHSFDISVSCQLGRLCLKEDRRRRVDLGSEVCFVVVTGE